MLLHPEPLPFRISTVDLTLVYREQGALAWVDVEAQTWDDLHAHPAPRYRSLRLMFDRVHEARCRGGNLHEMRYGEITEAPGPEDEDAYWRSTGLCPSPGLYRAADHEAVAALRAHYDPRGSSALQLFIVAGYDSHVEILASHYRYTLADTINEHEIVTVGPHRAPD